MTEWTVKYVSDFFNAEHGEPVSKDIIDAAVVGISVDISVR